MVAFNLLQHECLLQYESVLFNMHNNVPSLFKSTFVSLQSRDTTSLQLFKFLIRDT